MNRIHRYALAAAVTLLVAACGEQSGSPLAPSLESRQQQGGTTTIQTTNSTTTTSIGEPVEGDSTVNRGGYSIGGN